MSVRFELRVPEELMAAIDAARGHEKRAAFIKRTLESALGPQTKAPELREPHGGNASPASSRAPVRAAIEREVVGGHAEQDRREVPGPVPSVRRGNSDALARQARLNKEKGL